jgi:hypothetical protein
MNLPKQRGVRWLEQLYSTTSSHLSSLGLLWRIFGLPSVSSLTSFHDKKYTCSALSRWSVFYPFECPLRNSCMSSQTHFVNLGVRGIYASALALQFILALGNRPKGERIPYIITFWCASNDFWLETFLNTGRRLFGVLAVYLLVCSLWLTIAAFAVRGPADIV